MEEMVKSMKKLGYGLMRPPYIDENGSYNNPEYARRRYGNLVINKGKASDCIGCGACESHCPQKIKIINELHQAAELLDNIR